MKLVRTMRFRSVLTALTLVVAPGVAVLGTATDAFAVTKISQATAESMFRQVYNCGGC
ncbi:hypothetical protein [Streptomyces fodineus]|uniref:hypothetical protein n=1 Tax=Streptomyces fodineus TaxID=1904616 RepID=UPI000AA8920C|nr:hypothetical protein [Streptomyces fodineus]